MSPIVATLANAGARGYGGLRSFGPETAFESIATSTPSGTNTVTFSSIPQTYKHLQLRVFVLGPGGNGDIRFNGDTGNNYNWNRMQGTNIVEATGATSVNDNDQMPPVASGQPMTGIIDINDYAQTTKNKVARCFGSSVNNTSGSGSVYLSSVLWASTAAITSVTYFHSGNFTSGTVIALYGTKG